MLEKRTGETEKYPSVLVLRDFTEGKNAFTMSVDEKVYTAERKKEMGVVLIGQAQWKKAYKVFQNTNSLFELGVDE